jgi:hypothetical protein
MAKIGRQTTSDKAGREPAWIRDKANQAEWTGRFIGILKRDYGSSDSAISAILSIEELVQMCALKMRCYANKEATRWLYKQRKARGAVFKSRLEIAIAGMQVAIDFYTDQGNQSAVLVLRGLGTELSEKLDLCKVAFATKRHGRDRAHSILSECHLFLEARLGQAISFVTLANLVNAGYEADGILLKEPISEEQIRKNLTLFRCNNPLWDNAMDAYAMLTPVNPATK